MNANVEATRPFRRPGPCLPHYKLGIPNVAEVAGVLAGVREPIPVKKLLLVAEMSLDASGRIDGARLAATLQEAGIL